MSKAYRVREEQSEKIKNKMVELIIKHKETVKESDIIHALIDKYIDEISLKDVEISKENKEFKKTK